VRDEAGTVEIALTFDDGFWAPCYATMRSICLTTHHPERLRFHLLHQQLTPAHRAALESIEHDYGASTSSIWTLAMCWARASPAFRAFACGDSARSSMPGCFWPT
jgi:hypothetical protein